MKGVLAIVIGFGMLSTLLPAKRVQAKGAARIAADGNAEKEDLLVPLPTLTQEKNDIRVSLLGMSKGWIVCGARMSAPKLLTIQSSRGKKYRFRSFWPHSIFSNIEPVPAYPHREEVRLRLLTPSDEGVSRSNEELPDERSVENFPDETDVMIEIDEEFDISRLVGYDPFAEHGRVEQRMMTFCTYVPGLSDDGNGVMERDIWASFRGNIAVYVDSYQGGPLWAIPCPRIAIRKLEDRFPMNRDYTAPIEAVTFSECRLFDVLFESDGTARAVPFYRMNYVVERLGTETWESETMGPVQIDNEEGMSLYDGLRGWDYESRDLVLCQEVLDQAYVTDPRRAFLRTVTLYGKPKLKNVLEVTIHEAFDETEATFVFPAVPVPG